jgi:hypothetical protein
VFDSSKQLTADVLPADDVKIEVDPIVEVGQKIKDLVYNQHVVLPFASTYSKRMGKHELDDFEA